MKLTIVIPVYNEQENIKKEIEAIEEKVKIPHETLLVYDFDQDNTLPLARELIRRYPYIKLVHNKYGKGVLNAIKTGLEEASGEAVIVTMADLADDPATMNKMVDKFEEGFDIVCGSRYMKGGRQIGAPKIKSFLSQTAGILGHFLIALPTHDLTNSFKLYRKSLLDKITIESRGGFELGMEIVLKAYFLNAKITEVPTTWHDRTVGTSKFKLFPWLPRYLYWFFWGLKKKALIIFGS